MCGILTEFVFDPSNVSPGQDFSDLLELSKHRGPDNTMVQSGKQYRLGFNRLAILDLSERGNQPKYSPSQRYHVVFNGEIYNYRDLEAIYALTHLESTSDTEVLVHLLDVLGVVKTLEILNGMFAIAVMDTETHTFYLARDFAGIKPLFYGLNKNGLVAASQFNQVFKHPFFNDHLKLRPEIMKAYFGFGYMQAPDTIYEGIYQVEPGQCVELSQNGTVKRHFLKTFAPTYTEPSEDKEVFASTKQLLQDAVKRQLVSDVPLATFLSGGIDSPLITAIAKEHNPAIEAFTLAVDDAKMDESEMASVYATSLTIKHSIEHVNETDLLASIDAHFNYLTEPFGDYSSIPTYLITKKAKQNYTVMLSGDGGDELFFGYPRMLTIVNNRNWFNIPFALRKPLVRLAHKLGFITTWGPYHYKTIGDWVKAKHTYIFKDQLDGICPDTPLPKTLNALYQMDASSRPKEILDALRHIEFYGHLQRVLIKVDRMSMANSLEVRVPFLDRYVIERAFQFVPRTYTTPLDLKRILKTIMQDYFPIPSIVQEKKGFAVPVDSWLNHQLYNDLKTVIFETPIFGAQHLDVIKLRQYVRDYYDKKHDSAWGVWHIYAWQKWALNEGLV